MNSLEGHTAQLPELAGSRRRWLMGGVAVAAGLGGAAWGVRHLQVQPAADAAVTGLWASSFDAPQGGVVSMGDYRGKKLAVNFWATWCPPCVDELPLLERFYRENSSTGWNVVGLAIDQPSAVRTFLGRMRLTFPVGLAGLDGTTLAKSLGNLAGGLPFTVVFGLDGQVLQRKMGRLTDQDLAAWRAMRG